MCTMFTLIFPRENIHIVTGEIGQQVKHLHSTSQPGFDPWKIIWSLNLLELITEYRTGVCPEQCCM